jgi:CBS domain-containing protein
MNNSKCYSESRPQLNIASQACCEDLLISHVMNPHVITVKSDESLSQAIKTMSQNHISCLPVVDVDCNQFIGLITQKSVLNLINTQGPQLSALKVKDHMILDVPTISPDVSALEATTIAQDRGVKWLPVLSETELVGIVTQTDLAQALTCFDCFPEVASIVSSATVTIDAADTLATAACIMTEQNISCLIALRQEKPIGILTEKDILKYSVETGNGLQDSRVVDVMSFPIISVSSSDSTISASRLMDRMRMHHLVVMDDERLCGIITKTDVLKALRESLS